MWGRDNQNRQVTRDQGPNMNINQDPPEDARDNFGDDGANNLRGGGVRNPLVQNPPMQFPSLRKEGNNLPIDPLTRSIRDYLQPTQNTTPSCILLPVQVDDSL